jgi:hypothetical protein
VIEWALGQLTDFEIRDRIAACRAALNGSPDDPEEITRRLEVYVTEMAARKRARRGLPSVGLSERFPEDAS